MASLWDAQTVRERIRLGAAVVLAVGCAIAIILAPDRKQQTLLLLIGATTGILAYLRARDWNGLGSMFRGLWYVAAGLSGLGLMLLLSGMLPGAVGDAFTSGGVVLAKLAIAVFVTSETGRLYWR